MKKILLISGHIGTGKTKLARNLHTRLGYYWVKTSGVLRKYVEFKKLPPDRLTFQNIGDSLDTETNGKWVLQEVFRIINSKKDAQLIVVDSIRDLRQIESIRKEFGFKVVHVHLTASKKILEERFESRKERKQGIDSNTTFHEANLNKTENEVNILEKEADLCVDTERGTPEDTYVRVASRLGAYAPPSMRCVDVIVGGQFGSEGKGHVAAYLSKNYDVLMRVGGPNAGHTVRSESGTYVYHHLPSGTKDTDAKILIGPGAVINPEKILKEIDECKIRPGRLFIDPQAILISKEDIEKETKLIEEIGSTGSGTGSATANKIMGRSGKPEVTLAKDNQRLHPYIGKAYEHLEEAYSKNSKILLEGTQGSGLSIHHGVYPHVTSRETNVAGCLSEAGISPNRVRKVIMVVRTYPIRVANPNGPEKTSGFLKNEISFNEIAERSSLDADEISKAEKTSTTGRDRRVGEFNWEQFRHACALNAPTDIVLTFADYLSKENQNARRFEQLHSDTIRFIEELERVAHAPVSLINTRFNERSVIDRRDW